MSEKQNQSDKRNTTYKTTTNLKYNQLKIRELTKKTIPDPIWEVKDVAEGNRLDA